MPLKNVKKVSNATIERLAYYQRFLEGISGNGRRVISSEEMGEHTGTTAAQVRKDLSCFGEFGKLGRGYDIEMLNNELSAILGVNRVREVALVGVGFLGSALLAYPGFRRVGFRVTAIFDNDFRKVGKNWEGVQIQNIADLPGTVREREIRIGVIAVPAEVAQETADLLVSAGIRSILNFAPVRVSVGPEVKVRNVDLASELQCLAFHLEQ